MDENPCQLRNDGPNFVIKVAALEREQIGRDEGEHHECPTVLIAHDKTSSSSLAENLTKRGIIYHVAYNKEQAKILIKTNQNKKCCDKPYKIIFGNFYIPQTLPSIPVACHIESLFSELKL